VTPTADGARVAAWVATRTPEPPPALAQRVGALYAAGAADAGADATASDLPTAGGCIDAAARAVGELIADGATSRATALDLLAADALATYAFELASARPDTLAALAEDAMRRFAALAAPTGSADGAA
jgi:hypothetical protein